MRKFVFGGSLSSLTVEDVKKFIHDFKSGSLRPHLKSEPVPSE
jgi:hypothetical protein